ncbi:DUF916 domain-containing protein [Enterococcus sp. 2201sp1_2201st1_B8_2201SCRN_220225]|uniref:DUF916 domain-containing protein n=1 Tax=unclassified Enterococcus TaxID=2608891 RepID=UPI0034A29963
MDHQKRSLLVILFIFFLSYAPVQAQATGAGYGVTPLLPENQLDEATYFNLLVAPGDTQRLSIQLTNQENQPKILHIAPTTATTSNIGAIQYTTTKPELLKGPVLSELLSAPKTVTLQSQETKIIDFTLTMPQESFQGILLGSFLIQEVGQNSNANGIANQFAYEIGLMIRESKKLPSMKISFHKLQLNNNDLTIQFKNQSGRLVSGTLKAKLVGKKQSFSKELQIAPNTASQIIFPFEKLPTGATSVKLTFTTDKGEKFDYQQGIYLYSQEGKLQLTKLSISWQWLITGGIFLAVCLLAITILFFKKHKKSGKSQ